MAILNRDRRKTAKLTVQLALLWCYFKYGTSIWQPWAIALSFKKITKTYGQYRHFFYIDADTGNVTDNVSYIYINLNQHKNRKECVETLIHEYTHHKQHINAYDSFFNKGYKYDNHPLEQEAIKVSSRDVDECYEWVQSRLKTIKRWQKKSILSR